MKRFPLLPSEVRVTDSIFSNFKRARRRLVLLYLLIVGGVIGLFSLLLLLQVDDPREIPAVPPEGRIMLTEGQARTKALLLKPGRDIEEAEYEFENGTLFFTMKFSDGEEVDADLFTGKVAIALEDEEGGLKMLADDFDELVLWIALAVFLVAALGSVFVANKTLAPIVRNIQQQKQFIAGAAHELRNPLAALHARLESLIRTNEPGLTRKTVDDLLTETKQLIATSESLLAIERQGYIPKMVESRSVKESTSAILKRFAFLIAQKNLQIRTELSPAPLMIDQGDLEIILQNLIHNALKFTPAGGSITLSWKNQELTVQDTGIGIDQKHFPYIFEPFYKGEASKGFGVGGSGLGLALVQEIAHHYRATLQVTSVPGQGTIMKLVFPQLSLRKSASS